MGFSFGKLAIIIVFAGGVNTAFGQLLWSDEFDTGTTLDPNTWSYDLGDSGWGNQELQNYTNDPDNVRLDNGNLAINIRSTGEGENRQFTSARVRTQDKLTFKYGRIEARIKMPDLADGLWPAFWTLGNNFSQVGWPYCGELDIMEMGSASAITAGVINRRVGSAAHWDNDGTWASYTRSYDTASDLDDGFHIFSMDWTPERITSYIDGQQIWTFYIKDDACASCNEFHQPHFIILNTAVGGTYTGLLSADQITAALPAEMLIDYVRIYDNGFTELGGSSLPEPSVPGLEYSGSWFNQDQSGHGFSMAFSTTEDETPMAVVYWYTYDTDGKPTFLLGTGSLEGDTLEVEYEAPYGMIYGDFDPDAVIRESGGIARFEFIDERNATFSYEPSEFTASDWGHSAIQSLALSRLFVIPVSDSSSTVE
jgi:beta-glucanase (GH16 family)